MSLRVPLRSLPLLTVVDSVVHASRIGSLTGKPVEPPANRFPEALGDRAILGGAPYPSLTGAVPILGRSDRRVLHAQHLFVERRGLA